MSAAKKHIFWIFGSKYCATSEKTGKVSRRNYCNLYVFFVVGSLS